MPDLAGKHGLIVGVANKRSIAWAIAQAASNAGARLALTYQGERLAENVTELAATIGALVRPCDVTDDRQIADVAAAIEGEFGGLDFLVHGAAFALKADLDNQSAKMTCERMRIPMDVC